MARTCGQASHTLGTPACWSACGCALARCPDTGQAAVSGGLQWRCRLRPPHIDKTADQAFKHICKGWPRMVRCSRPATSPLHSLPTPRFPARRRPTTDGLVVRRACSPFRCSTNRMSHCAQATRRSFGSRTHVTRRLEWPAPGRPARDGRCGPGFRDTRSRLTRAHIGIEDHCRRPLDELVPTP